MKTAKKQHERLEKVRGARLQNCFCFFISTPTASAESVISVRIVCKAKERASVGLDEMIVHVRFD